MRRVLCLAVILAACAPRQSAQTSSPDEAVDLPAEVARAVLVGSALASAGDLAGALPYFKFAHDNDPADPHLAERYADTALELGQPRVALAALERTAALTPMDPLLEGLRIRLLLGLRQVDRADSLTAAFLEEAPEDPDFLELRALVLEQGEDPLVALRAYEALAERRDVDAATYERMAYLALHAEQPEVTAEYARMALRRDPRGSGALELLAAALRELSREEEFEAILRELLEENPRATELHSALADLLLARGDSEGAVELLMPLAERGELGRYPRIILAELLMRLNRLDESAKLLAELNAEGEGEPMVLRLLGEVATRRGELDQAVEYLNAALRADGTDRETMLALLLAESQRSPEVFDEDGPPSRRRDAFNRLLTRADQLAEEPNLRFDYLIGTLMRRAGRYGEALRRLERAQKQDPESPEIVYDLAVCLEQLERDDDTRTTLERLVELAPEEANYLNFLGYFLAERGEELERAEELIQAALKLEPENPYFLDSLAWVYYQDGRFEHALEQLKLAQVAQDEELADDPTVLEHLGDVYRAMDRPEEALEHYRAALENGGSAEKLTPRIEALQDLLREGP